MPNLVSIGNSKGVRIPKLIIEQAGLEGRELELRVVKDGLLIRPAHPVRERWKEAFDAMHVAGDDAMPSENPGTTRFDDEEWEWS